MDYLISRLNNFCTKNSFLSKEINTHFIRAWKKAVKKRIKKSKKQTIIHSLLSFNAMSFAYKSKSRFIPSKNNNSRDENHIKTAIRYEFRIKETESKHRREKRRYLQTYFKAKPSPSVSFFRSQLVVES